MFSDPFRAWQALGIAAQRTFFAEVTADREAHGFSAYAVLGTFALITRNVQPVVLRASWSLPGG